ncbi:hypothetical protein [Sodalis praecaptivus]|uniref:hypothetical protein n=1 Tax=Sodalis praecaptivus TaxID=1239307 RepID=UPI00046D8A40|nr:hypothetical protein [Sodalis praecaptivus]
MIFIAIILDGGICPNLTLSKTPWVNFLIGHVVIIKLSIADKRNSHRFMSISNFATQNKAQRSQVIINIHQSFNEP